MQFLILTLLAALLTVGCAQPEAEPGVLTPKERKKMQVDASKHKSQDRANVNPAYPGKRL